MRKAGAACTFLHQRCILDAMAKRTYTDEQKAKALDLYEKHGAGEAARQMGIPVQTISSWARRSGKQTDAPANLKAAIEIAQLTREQKREVLRNPLLDKALDMLSRMGEPHIDYKGKDVVKVRWEKARASAKSSGDAEESERSSGVAGVVA